MTWPTRPVTDIAELNSIADSLGQVGPVAALPYIYRGHSNSEWPLRSSLNRLLKPGLTSSEAEAVEEDCRRNFVRQAHLHYEPFILPPIADKFDWWAVMQHHGAPTRLLDWTASFWVAVYFAVEADWDNDGAVWLIHLKSFADSFGLEGPSRRLTVFEPKRMSARMLAQQGLLMCPLTPIDDVTGLLSDALLPLRRTGQPHAIEVLRKIIIPADLKPKVLRRLLSVNITASTLFPGIDGLGRTTMELARLSSVFPREQRTSPVLQPPCG